MKTGEKNYDVTKLTLENSLSSYDMKSPTLEEEDTFYEEYGSDDICEFYQLLNWISDVKTDIAKRITSVVFYFFNKKINLLKSLTKLL